MCYVANGSDDSWIKLIVLQRERDIEYVLGPPTKPVLLIGAKQAKREVIPNQVAIDLLHSLEQGNTQNELGG